MSTDTIEDYLRRLRRRWWWRRDRDRRLVEVEDHLRSATQNLETQGLSHERAMSDAIARYATPTTLRMRWRVLSIGAALATAVAIGALTRPSTSHATIAVTPSNKPIAKVLGNMPSRTGSQPDFTIPPGTRIDATAPVPTAHATYVFITYTWRGRQCDGGYLATPGSLTPPPNQPNMGSSCQPPGTPRRPIDLQIQGGSGQPFILSGTAPQTADDLTITTALGQTHTFVLPHVALHTDPHRQAVILDLTAQHIPSVDRLTLLSHDRVIAEVRATA
jgi:hypothetical protein